MLLQWSCRLVNRNTTRDAKQVKTPQQYALYHGDTFVDVGTAAEISKHTGIALRTLMFYHTPTYRKTTDERTSYRLIDLEDDEQ